MLSLSKAIESKKKNYYQALEQSQRDNEITAWINYFVDTILEAQLQAKQLIDATLRKVRFFDQFRNQLNERQLKAIRKMLDAGPDGFEGGMTAKKYMAITRASKATATRDLQNLVDIQALIITGGGRSTHYTLNY
jgi:Fic family protein